MAKRLPAPPQSAAQQLKSFAREEYANEAKYSKNVVRGDGPPGLPALGASTHN